MNNGNLLSSLLGATGAGSSAAKAVAPKSRPDTSEKFQQAFDRVRPEVAARKPAAGKVPERNSATERPQAAAKSYPHPEPAANRPSVEGKKTAKTHEVPEAHVTESSSTTAEDKAISEEITSVAEGAVAKEELTVVDNAGDETLLLSDPVLLIATSKDTLQQPTQVGILPEPATASTENMVLAENPDPLLLGVEGELEEGSAEIDPVSLNPESDEAATDPLLELGASSVAAVSVQSTPVLPEAENADAELMSSIESNAATHSAQVAQSTAAITQAVTVKTPEQLLADETQMSQSVAGQPASSSTASPTVTETNAAMNFADNPDFVLLNTKAGLDKMAEANLTSMDKALPAAEVAKPAVPASVLEALARPLETQSPAARAFVVQTGVPVTVGSPQWSQAVGDKVLWLAAQNVSAAEIRLDPPELGPMQVKVSITNDQASVSFTSHNPMVRDALDQQLNRLREMFSEQGLNLVNVDVSDKSFAQQEREREDANKSRASTGVDEEELTPVAITQVVSMRLVDHYA